MKLVIAKWIFKNLSGGPEYCTPPGDWLRFEFGDEDEGKPMFVARTSNDGYELWIAYNNGGKWLWHCDDKYAYQLARWILWNWWAKSTWFGFKRRIWYWSLHTKLMADDWYRARYGAETTGDERATK